MDVLLLTCKVASGTNSSALASVAASVPATGVASTVVLLFEATEVVSHPPV